MHYKAFLITKEFPTDDRIKEIMRPFNGEDYYNRKDEGVDEPYPVFTWDWYCVGGRYNSFFELDKDNTLRVDGGLISDMKDFDITQCYIIIDADGNAYARSSWDGNTFVEDEGFDDKTRAILEVSKDYYIVTVDVHD